ncbi:sigma-70 family RNA polymerase sigma factor [Bacillus sp. BGMRC 2118]|nr:sigma-70 family RNA polymerase sigma factor [Bacillus sp. BGMRC 2118]
MNEYGERLTRLAYNYVKDWGKAEDIVQEVFITCYDRFDEVERIISYKSWVYKITINRCKDVLKSSFFKKVIVNYKLFSHTQSRELTPEKRVVKNNEEELLARCVLALPIKYREVIILFYYEELSILEIAELLSLNTNTIKTRLSRARVVLKEQLEGWEANG